MESHPIDTPTELADRLRAVGSARRAEILIFICGPTRPSGSCADAAWYLTQPCDLVDCLELARKFSEMGATAISFGALFEGDSQRIEWRWRRVSKAERQTRALLESKKMRDAERDARAAAAPCAACGHPAGAHEPPGVEAYGCHGGGGECTCEGFSSGLVRVSR